MNQMSPGNKRMAGAVTYRSQPSSSRGRRKRAAREKWGSPLPSELSAAAWLGGRAPLCGEIPKFQKSKRQKKAPTPKSRLRDPRSGRLSSLDHVGDEGT